MRTTSLLTSSLLLVAALGACKSKEDKKTPPPAAEKPAEQPAPAPVPAPAPTPAPAADVDTLITGDRIGPVHLGSPLAAAAFPGAQLEKQTEQAEGDEFEVGAIVENGKTLLVLTDDGGTITGIRTEDPRFKTEAGIGVGSTADQVATAYGKPITKEEEEVLEGETCVEFAAAPNLAFCCASDDGWKGAVATKDTITFIALRKL
ncbi:MAG TPA: hypothetical protein VMZ28_08425 [Kofleriaceae bacterium]|nr:hypothetical protein [Kofleriaceae bacterium]